MTTPTPATGDSIAASKDVNPEDVRAAVRAGNPLAAVLHSAMLDVDAASEALRDAIRIAQANLERAVAQLDAGHGINSLGILQGSAADVDRCAALYAAKVQHLSGLCYAYRNTEAGK